MRRASSRCTACRSGAPDGNHWGPAATVFETTSATPYFFNFHEGDLGNFTVIGPSGSGKTVVLNFLAAQAQKFAPRTILFDKDRGAEIFLRAAGGHYARLQPGEPTGFNPLQLPDTAVNRGFLRDWLGVMLAARGPGGDSPRSRPRSMRAWRPSPPSAACAISANCSAARGGPNRATSPRGSIRGSARANMPGCSTMPSIGSISTRARSAST